MIPIVKWSGGKQDEIKYFEKYIPKDYDTYIEPFVGGGALFFNLNNKKNIISDMHKELIDFYNSIKNGKSKEIYDFMKKNKNNEETYYKIRDDIEHEDELENAKRFFYLSQFFTCNYGK
jgi:DNA adenine methylase